MSATQPSLAIILVARNEAANIARAIESARQAAACWPQAEVMLVDSASTDATVEIARRYPITILRLRPEWFISAAAARRVGMAHTQGELILHMDSDMELLPDCLEWAAPYLLAHPEVGAVGGYRTNIYIEHGREVDREDVLRDPHGRIRDVDLIGGVGLYRRAALEAMGGHNPYIKGEQDTYLCLGLRHAGYRVVRLPHCMSRHYCLDERKLAGNLRRLRLNLWLGYGQLPRYYLGSRLFWEYLKIRKTSALYLGALAASLVWLAAAALWQSPALAGAWLLALGLLTAALAVRRGSLHAALVTLAMHTFITYSALRGFLIRPIPPAQYPTDAEVIQAKGG